VVNDDALDLTQQAAEELAAQDELDQVHDVDGLDEDQEILDAEAAVVPLHQFESEASS
jgi:hypothetical protein